ncbi:hypothetical protein MRS44_018381 [Fusarium solani]|uniref:uncharacterized protein n=1 Tax=Fusarium solani TaxID=169388 RepID=UPI0032C408B6|nr:hypothetical protein MRS44_018381 [Fusarium solani]
MGVAHFDLMLENLLLAGNGLLKISDFGNSDIGSPGNLLPLSLRANFKRLGIIHHPPWRLGTDLKSRSDYYSHWFLLVQNTIAKYGITLADIYNFDEAGFMMGMIASEMVVTSADRRERPKSVQPGNREWATVIQAINAEGWAIQPLIVVAGQHHLASWYWESSLPGDWAIATTHNGWTDNETDPLFNVRQD